MYKLVTTLNELTGLKSEWDHLGEKFDSPMLQFDWFFCCAKYLHPESELRVFLVYSEDRLIAIAPLVRTRYKFSQWLEIIGNASTYEPTGLLYKDKESLELLLRSVFQYGLPVNLQRLSQKSPEAVIVNTVKKPLRLLLQRRSASSYYIKPVNDWDSFLSKSGKKWRSDFRNKMNRANRLGDIEIDYIHSDFTNFEECFKEAMEVESRSWKGKQKTALINNKKLRDFFRAYFSFIAKQKRLHFAFFRINKKPVAMHIAESHKNTLWSYKIGYDSSFSRISPGMLLILAVLKDVFKNKQSYEFLGSAESWQKAWAVQEHRYCSIIIYPLSLYGLVGLLDTLSSVLYNKFQHIFLSFSEKYITKS